MKEIIATVLFILFLPVTIYIATLPSTGFLQTYVHIFLGIFAQFLWSGSSLVYLIKKGEK